MLGGHAGTNARVDIFIWLKDNIHETADSVIIAFSKAFLQKSYYLEIGWVDGLLSI